MRGEKREERREMREERERGEKREERRKKAKKTDIFSIGRHGLGFDTKLSWKDNQSDNRGTKKRRSV
jgi:hypothetical protein